MNVFSKIAWKTLTKNRTRTLVTIIGIALSAAMFTAVTTAISSYIGYYRGYAEYNYGSWNTSYYDLSAGERTEMESDSNMKTVTALEQIGFAVLTDSVNEYKPYLYVCAMDDNATELLPIHLTDGRMPENASEILIPDHLSTNGGVDYEIGDVITLEIGERTYDGSVLNNHSSYNEEGESVENCTTYTYTVVGTYSRPSIEDYYAPGYTALTVSVDSAETAGEVKADAGSVSGTIDSTATVTADTSGSTENAAVSKDSSSGVKYDVYYQLKDEYQAAAYQPTYLTGEHTWITNDHYLAAWGLTDDNTEYTLLYSFGSILIGIILFGSVALIYNSFSISVSERMHLFSMLSSVGATRRQLVRMVLTEGLLLGCFGIPLGILAGLFGMWVTFSCIGEDLSALLYEGYPETFALAASPIAILTASVIALITILISAYLPARKALKHSAMETIRGNHEVQINAKEKKTSGLMQRAFGFEAMLASRNYRRSRRKYRATVVSIFVSIVLFVTSSSFCAYMQETLELTYQDVGYDVCVQAILSEESDDGEADTNVAADANAEADVNENADAEADVNEETNESADTNSDKNVTAIVGSSVITDSVDYERVKETAQKLEGLTGVTSVHYSSILTATIMVEKEELDDSYENYHVYLEGEGELPDQVFVRAAIVFMEDAEFDTFAKSQGLEASDYRSTSDTCNTADAGKTADSDVSADAGKTADSDVSADAGKTFDSDVSTESGSGTAADFDDSDASNELRVICYDKLKYYGSNDQIRYASLFGSRGQKNFSFALAAESEDYWYMGCWVEDGIYQWTYEAYDTGEIVYLPASENMEAIMVTADLAAELPDSLPGSAYTGAQVICLLPYSRMEEVFAWFTADAPNVTLAGNEVFYTISTEYHATTVSEIVDLAETLSGVSFIDIEDIAEEKQTQRAFLWILQVFCYGFIILISLIAVANVFNTISTNIGLRGREFAMLQSVGMTRRSMQRMMSYECLLYGSRGLIAGLVVSILLSYGIYLLTDVGIGFFVPWYSLIIAIAGVFVVVFSTMLYAVRRLQKGNTIDVLKNENV